MSQNNTQNATTGITQNSTQNTTTGTTQNNTQNKSEAERQTLLDALNKLSKKIGATTVKENEKRYIFAKYDLEDDDLRGILQTYESEIKKFNYLVEICENIDIKEVTDDKKFYIRITGRNGNYVIINFFEYREITLDFTQDMYEYIAGHIKRMVGVLDRCDKEVIPRIVEYLSYLSFYKKGHTKVYNKVGWSSYDGFPIFKYDEIYSSNDNNGAKRINGRCISGISEALSAENSILKVRLLGYCKQ